MQVTKPIIVVKCPVNYSISFKLQDIFLISKRLVITLLGLLIYDHWYKMHIIIHTFHPSNPA